MTKAKFNNDTTKTRLGDQYQYLIALECCINAKSEEDIIYIEQRGDVATLDESTEVKHHLNPNHKISDRSVDFWKTLKNWVENYDVISSYKKFVLLTTSDIQENSKLVDWNSLTKEEKLKQIIDIKEKKITETIKDFVDFIFTFNERIDAKVKQLRQVDLSIKKKEAAHKTVEDELKGYFKNYYSFIGLEFNNNLSLSQLLNSRSNLPDYTSESFASPDLTDRYNFLKREIESKGSDHSILQGKIKDLEETENYANQFQIALKTLDLKSESSNSTNDSYNCPTCGTETLSLSEEMQIIETAQKQLSKELELIGGYKFSYQKEIDSLKKEQAELRREIKVLTTQKDEIEKITESIAKQKSVSEQAIYAKAQLDLRIELMSKEKNIVIIDETEEIKGQLEILRQKLTQFSVDREREKANAFLANNMNKIGDKLDCEEQLKPLNFHFNLRDFKFTHIAPNIGEIALSEMGSGANWLACHISLFMSLLHYLAKQKDSVVPSFLFLDQPSQVYFPSKFGESQDKDNDISQVEKVYIAILEELNEIKESAGYLPQVIVTDHADNLDLGKYKFDDYVRKRWIPEKDKALI